MKSLAHSSQSSNAQQDPGQVRVQLRTPEVFLPLPLPSIATNQKYTVLIDISRAISYKLSKSTSMLTLRIYHHTHSYYEITELDKYL